MSIQIPQTDSNRTESSSSGWHNNTRPYSPELKLVLLLCSPFEHNIIPIPLLLLLLSAKGRGVLSSDICIFSYSQLLKLTPCTLLLGRTQLG